MAAGVVGQAELLSAALVPGALLLHQRWRPPVAARANAAGRRRASAAASGRARNASTEPARTGRDENAAPDRAGGAAPWIAAALSLVASHAKESALPAIGLVAAYEITFRYGARPVAWAKARAEAEEAARLSYPVPPDVMAGLRRGR